MSDGGPYVGDSRDNVVDLPCEIDHDAIVRMLHRAGIKDFVLIGCDRDGYDCTFTDLENGGDILWHLRRTEHKLMSSADGIVVSPENSA